VNGCPAEADVQAPPPPGENESLGNLTLVQAPTPQPTTVTGTILGVDGSGIAGVPVTVSSADVADTATVFTGPSGVFLVRSFPARAWSAIRNPAPASRAPSRLRPARRYHLETRRVSSIMEARWRIQRGRMATLNLKNFPENLYAQLRARARRERRSVAQEVVHLLERAVGPASQRSILELRGLGKECWEGVDPVDHVRAERDSWGS
jgi:plasmid stability protein